MYNVNEKKSEDVSEILKAISEIDVKRLVITEAIRKWEIQTARKQYEDARRAHEEYKNKRRLQKKDS